jgi:hypothetical protein
MKKLKAWAVAATMVALTGAAQAALVAQGNGTVLDTTTNLIWLQDWHSIGYGTWATQKAWAETTLDGFAGSNDWRLPEISEYVDLYNAYGDHVSASNTTPFINAQPANYWSGTEVAPGVSAKWYRSDYGAQGVDGESSQYFTVAVRNASVPEPQTLALALLALGATVVARRRRPA